MRVWLDLAVYRPGLEGAVEPVTGAQVYVYRAATVVEKPVYPELVPAGALAMVQPLSSDNGMVAGYVEPAAYDALVILPDGDEYTVRIERPSAVDQRVPLPTKAGAFTDADFADPVNGLQGLDTTNHRLYMRSGGTWRYVALT
jgi:hypothetical protein